MTDPDLSADNESAAALTVVVDGGLPEFTSSLEDVAAARAEAAALVRRDPAGSAPAPVGETPSLRDRSVASHLAAVKGAGRCASQLSVSTVWAARLPAALPVFPRGATVAGAGSDAPGCRSRVVGFVTPVAVGDVLDFYWRRARGAGLSPTHRTSGEDHVIAGRGATLAFDLRVVRQGGQTVVRLATLER